MAWTGTNYYYYYYYYYYYRPISIIFITYLLCGVGSCPYSAASNDRITAGNELQRMWKETAVYYEVLRRHMRAEGD
jgi:hypothetical protein